jgi:hypothetical protein
LTPEAAHSFVEQVIFPTLARAEQLSNERKILAAVPVAGLPRSVNGYCESVGGNMAEVAVLIADAFQDFDRWWRTDFDEEVTELVHPIVAAARDKRSRDR